MQKLGAEARPIQVCVGTLKGDFGAVRQSKHDPENPSKTIYSYNELMIHGLHGAQDMKMRLLWLPEWFDPKFSLKRLTASQSAVYSRTIGSNDGTALGNCGLVEGLCGDPETAAEFSTQQEQLGTYDVDTVDDFLRSFFRALGPAPFLYELKQERKKSGTDDQGKNVYTRGRFMEVTAIEHITEYSVKSLAKRMERNRKRIADAEAEGKEAPVLVLAKFDPADYGFDDIVFPQDAEPAWVGA